MTPARIAVALAAAALLIAAPTSWAQLPVLTPSGAPGVASTTPIPTPEPIAAVRVLEAPESLSAAAIRQLALELQRAPGGRVVLLVPADVRLEDGAAEAVFEQRVALAEGDLAVIERGDATASDGDAAALRAIADDWQRLDPERCDVACVDAALATLDLDGSETALTGSLDGTHEVVRAAVAAPAPEDDGLPIVPVAVALLALAAGGGLLALRRPGRHRTKREPEPSPPPAPPEPPPRDRRPDPPPAPMRRTVRPRSGAGRPARVVSVLDPEGYVELDGCLRRAAWASAGVPPSVPGEWVEIEDQHGRLWAFPSVEAAPDRGRLTERSRKR